MIVARFFLLIISILLFAGCSSKKPQAAVGFSFDKPGLAELKGNDQCPMREDQMPASIVGRSQARSLMRMQEAKFPDIPTPLGLIPEERFITSDNKTVTFAYKTSMTGAELNSFYSAAMEHQGWLLRGRQENVQETLLIWRKSRRICTISLRDGYYYTNHRLVLIMVGNMEGDNS